MFPPPYLGCTAISVGTEPNTHFRASPVDGHFSTPSTTLERSLAFESQRPILLFLSPNNFTQHNTSLYAASFTSPSTPFTLIALITASAYLRQLTSSFEFPNIAVT
eukprot:JP447783.1.p2 GENE.JP447783.1~~JP447783.1.p2  ORF type:complete len:106 (-),score=10.15 JP447783.1:69-386(-)